MISNSFLLNIFVLSLSFSCDRNRSSRCATSGTYSVRLASRFAVSGRAKGSMPEVGSYSPLLQIMCVEFCSSSGAKWYRVSISAFVKGRVSYFDSQARSARVIFTVRSGKIVSLDVNAVERNGQKVPVLDQKNCSSKNDLRKSRMLLQQRVYNSHVMYEKTSKLISGTVLLIKSNVCS